jgi:hypothetical protein
MQGGPKKTKLKNPIIPSPILCSNPKIIGEGIL